MISPYVRRLRLARELRTLRAEAGYTHEQLARQIGESRAQISRLENGHVVDQADIIKILDALEVDDERWTKVVTIAREAGERGWWESNRAMGERQALYANLEAGAWTIREFHMTFIPGLLQTPEYTRARIEAESREEPVGYDAQKMLDARAARQRMIRRPGGPTYDVVLDEVAIRRWAAPREVVKAQLYHLAARVNGDPRTSVRVLPVDVLIGGYSVPRSSFSVYTFADPDDPTIVIVDTVTEDMVRTDPSDTERYTELFDRLVESAMPVEESLRFLIAAAKDTLSPRRIIP